MADINKVWLSGVVVSQPVLTKLSGRTPFTSFILQVNEHYQNKQGATQTKQNFIKIECLGKNAEPTSEKVKEGKRFIVDGYIRQDKVNNTDMVKVRAFAIYADTSYPTESYRQGLTQSLKILLESRDLETAIANLKELLEGE